VRRSAARDLYLAGALGRERGPSLAMRARLALALSWAEAGRRLGRVPPLLYAGWTASMVAVMALLAWTPAQFLGPRAAHRWGRRVARLFLRSIGQRLGAEGLENLADPGPFVLCANHASYADVPALLALLPVDFAFVAKSEVRNWPFVGSYIRRTGDLTVDRWDTEQSLSDARAIEGALQEGRTVLFFPEGTFTAAPGLRPFRLGAFKTAAITGTRVVPVALSGTRRVLRSGGWRPRRGRIRLWVGEPMAPEGDGWRAVVDLRDRTADAIARQCGEPRLDIVAAGPVRS
jgi:1-acyl-sn-glycerol-3-phosphate acyltransferase